MKDSQQVRVKPVGIVAAVAALLIGVGGGITWWTLSSRQSGEPEVISPLPSNSPTPSPSETSVPIPVPPPEAQQPEAIPIPSPEAQQPETIKKTVAIYQIEEQNGQIAWVSTPVQLEVKEDDPGVVLEVAFQRLLTQPTDENRFSEIPPNTQVLSVQANPNEVYVDLSPDFVEGGGSASMIGRLGQVIYTATSLNPDAQVWISVGGQPLEILGGEGLEVPQPATRKNFEAEFQGDW